MRGILFCAFVLNALAVALSFFSVVSSYLFFLQRTRCLMERRNYLRCWRGLSLFFFVAAASCLFASFGKAHLIRERKIKIQNIKSQSRRLIGQRGRTPVWCDFDFFPENPF